MAVAESVTAHNYGGDWTPHACATSGACAGLQYCLPLPTAVRGGVTASSDRRIDLHIKRRKAHFSPPSSVKVNVFTIITPFMIVYSFNTFTIQY